MSPPLIVIFGAAVQPDGRASAALVRRCAYGLAAARAHPDAPLLCSGAAAAGGGPSEASLIAAGLLDAGVAEARLILDEASRTTVENVEAAVRTARAGGHPGVVACSDAYHLPRIRLLLRLHGLPCEAWAGAGGPSFGHGLGMGLREALAIPHSVARALARAPRLRS